MRVGVCVFLAAVCRRTARIPRAEDVLFLFLDVILPSVPARLALERAQRVREEAVARAAVRQVHHERAHGGGSDGDELAARSRFPRDGLFFPERKRAGFGFDAGDVRRRRHLRARRAHDVLVRGDRQDRNLRERELILEEAPFARSALAFLEPRLDEVQHRLGHDRALQPEVGDFGPVQAVVLEDGDVRHGGEHQRQRRGTREPALSLHQEHS